ncbi:MAG: HPr(Ser) kinase/phosphatase [Lachnospiraceae bacterium]
MCTITVKKLEEQFKMSNFTPEVPCEERMVLEPDINRPALQLTGYFEHFEEHRVQIIGTVEYTYLQHLTPKERIRIYTDLLAYDIPCFIFCRGFIPDSEFLSIATESRVPVFGTEQPTSNFMAEMIYHLNMELAPCISIHGVLVDVYGEGLLIMGESGIGKSEAALELIRRGHRLVADDVVEIRKMNEHTLVGNSPALTKYFIEVRGIGIIDVKMLFGAECVKEKQNIDMVIKLQEWEKGADYDRMGLEENYIEFLGNEVVCQCLPIRPGRNIAAICEAAAVNHRQKKMGYNAAQELYRRVQANIQKGKDVE